MFFTCESVLCGYSITSTFAATSPIPCWTASRHVPSTARNEGHRFAKSRAAAPVYTRKTPPIARPDFTSAATCLIAFTRLLASDGKSIAATLDSFDCAAIAAFAAPQAPSHHQSRGVDPAGDCTGSEAAVEAAISGLVGSISL